MTTPTTTAAPPVERVRVRYALFGSIGAGALAGVRSRGCALANLQP